MPSERISWRNAKQQAATVAKDDDSVSLVFGPNGFVEDAEEYVGNDEEYDETEEGLFEEDEEESSQADIEEVRDNASPGVGSNEALSTEKAVSVADKSTITVVPAKGLNSVDTPLTYIDDSSQIDPSSQSHHDSWTIFDSNPTSKWAVNKVASILDIGPAAKVNAGVSRGDTAADILDSDVIEKGSVDEVEPIDKPTKTAPDRELETEHKPETANNPPRSPLPVAAEKRSKPKWTKGLSAKSLDADNEVVSPGKSIGWQKPTWTKGLSLKNIHSETASPEKNIGWQKPNWTKAKLRSTGKNVKEGTDLEAPITHCRKDNKMDDINFEANPMVLKPSRKGTDVRLGENLAKPITHCAKDPMADVNFEANPEFALKPTEIGAKLKEKGDLQAPITHIPRDHLMDDINFEANPLILKPTEKGSAVRLGENLARPITFIIAKRPSEEMQ